MAVNKETRRGTIRQGDIAFFRSIPVGVISIKENGDEFDVITHEYLDKKGYRNVHCKHYDLRDFEFIEHICDIENYDDEKNIQALNKAMEKFHSNFIANYKKDIEAEAKMWAVKMYQLSLENKKKEMFERQEKMLNNRDPNSFFKPLSEKKNNNKKGKRR